MAAPISHGESLYLAKDLQQWSVNLGCLLPKIFQSVVGF
jgi:hypothetical protein